MQYADLDLARRLASTWFASIDPGLRNPAAAVWDRGRLVAASRVKVPKEYAELGRAERCRRVGALIAVWIREHAAPSAHIPVIGVEWPQIYSHGKGKGDPNLIVPLAGVDVAVACELDAEVLDYLPGEWSGGIPKSERGNPWDSPRGVITRSRLRDEELAVIVPSHDAVDAVAIGLKFLGRLERFAVDVTDG
jgi:hypothetical protein